jgi:arylsulfatase A-like enzyme
MNNLNLFSWSISAGALLVSMTNGVYAQKEPNKLGLSERNFPKPGGYPNIIIIETDQQRADVTRREGFSLDVTPFVDSLARNGVWFNRAYCSSPASVPSRTSMLTGRYPNSTRVRSNHNVIDAYFQFDLIDVLKHCGYRTALAGKNHSYLKKEKMDGFFEFGHQNAYDVNDDPENKKYDDFMRTLNMHYDPDPNPFPLKMQYPFRIVSKSLDWISEKDDRPFFLWMSFPEPHNPYQVPAPYYNMYPPGKLPAVRAGIEALDFKPYSYERQHELSEMALGDVGRLIPRIRSNYMGMLRMIDDQIRRFVTNLAREGKLDNTLIVIVSDHGDYAGEYGLIRKGAGTPEVLMRIPMVWFGKGIAPKSQPSEAHVSNVDMLPTICEVVGVDIPEGVQGRSLWPILTGKPYPVAEFSAAYAEQGFGGELYSATDTLNPRREGAVGAPGRFDELNTWTQSGSQRMLRMDDWKLEYDMNGNGSLFNLKNDPSEIKNLWSNPDYKDQKNRLVNELLRRAIRYQDDYPYPRTRYVMKKDPRNYYYFDK